MRIDFAEPQLQAAPFARGSRPRPVKLVIQIPCLNEEKDLPATLATLPRHLPGVDVIEWQIIDDGSTDRTIEVARACGVDHVVALPAHRGLARAFMAGLEHALAVGADIIVNTDADNQYDAACIPDLIQPILERRAEFVVGDRPIATIEHFSLTKRRLQAIGSRVVQLVSGTRINDAPSGFRALSREAAMRMNVFNSYTYTLETIIQAGLCGMRIVSVPIAVNGATRPSRLIRSNARYVLRSIGAIVRTFLIYKPGRGFFLLGLPPAVLGAGLMLRWLVLFLGGTHRAHVPSLVVAGVLIILAALLWACGLLGELFAINRLLLQDVQYRLRRERTLGGWNSPVKSGDG